MLKYKIVDNFISENECKLLIEDAEKFLEIKYYFYFLSVLKLY